MKDIERKLLDFAARRDWKKYHTPKDLAISVAIEAGELLEIFQWRNQGEPVSEQEREAIASEAADIAQYLVLLCAAVDVDLEEAIKSKIAVNEQRYPEETSRGIAKPKDQSKAHE
ncbi:nucleotide pyrophosphohydrolase [Ruegeria sp. HKCCA5014]|uniref:nucleotide pyrophosphohydrolase n=1 Tax=Ruegeria sp. HKCCA5014 TaxID=2682980 RepID=UPI00148A0F59|nr:nucleotide pyrophosphohydrolase [Ruegeria sp. HKCCA5014]